MLTGARLSRSPFPTPYSRSSLAQPPQQRLPVVLVVADVRRMVVEQALAQPHQQHVGLAVAQLRDHRVRPLRQQVQRLLRGVGPGLELVGHQAHAQLARSEEHTSELQSLMRISYAVFCLKKKNI